MDRSGRDWIGDPAARRGAGALSVEERTTSELPRATMGDGRISPHSIEIDLEDADQMAEFLVALAAIIRLRKRVRITIE